MPPNEPSSEPSEPLIPGYILAVAGISAGICIAEIIYLWSMLT